MSSPPIHLLHAMIRPLALPLIITALTAFTAFTAHAQDSTPRPKGAPPAEPRIPRGKAELKADDKPAFPPPDQGWDAVRESLPHGKLELISYESKTVGTTRKLNVYTPPGYSTAQRYPVLYLLHGIGGDESEWQRFANPGNLLDNLIANGKAVPMIIVMPNGRAQKNDRAESDVFKSAPAFATFEKDLLDDVIPTIDARYSTLPDKDHRALAGLSMGGGQSLNFGLTHLDTFSWIGGFSSAPNTKKPADLIPDAASLKSARLIWLSCGSKDGLLGISQAMHARLNDLSIPHTWHVTDHAHDPPEWKQALYHFLKQLHFPSTTTPPADKPKP